MGWTIEVDRRAVHDLKQLDRTTQQCILDCLEKRVTIAASPRDFGEAVTSTFTGLWRYRVGDYRVICHIEDAQLVLLVVRIGRRRDVYEREDEWGVRRRTMPPCHTSRGSLSVFRSLLAGSGGGVPGRYDDGIDVCRVWSRCVDDMHGV